jgi:hypothetical protein
MTHVFNDADVLLMRTNVQARLIPTAGAVQLCVSALALKMSQQGSALAAEMC